MSGIKIVAQDTGTGDADEHSTDMKRQTAEQPLAADAL